MSDSEEDVATDSYLLEKQQERSKLQDELSEYLEYISERKDSEGKPLVSIPANFNMIADSMNRDDIRPGEKAPWCQYLFQESFDNILKQEFEGRYDQYLRETPDVRISKGLAQIQLFDRQLQDLNRKDPLSARPNSVDINDRTFLTKKFEQESGIASGAVSPRSTKESARRNPVAVTSAPAEIPVAPATAVLSADANRRFEQLMSEDDEGMLKQDEYLSSLKEMEQAMHEIDEDLAAFGHLDRMVDAELETEKKEDVLTQQRKERANKEYMNKLDSMLEKIAKPLDVSGLVYESTNTTSGKSHKSNSSVLSKLEVPPPAAVKVDKLITMSDIVALLKVVHEQEDVLPSTPATTSSRRSHRGSSSNNHNNDNSTTSSSSGGGGGVSVESFETVEKLLKQYHSDIQRLAKVRAADLQIQLQQQQAAEEEEEQQEEGGTLRSGLSGITRSSRRSGRSGYSQSLNNEKMAGMKERARVLLRAVEDRLHRTEEIERGLLREEDMFSDYEEEEEEQRENEGQGRRSEVSGPGTHSNSSSGGRDLPSRHSSSSSNAAGGKIKKKIPTEEEEQQRAAEMLRMEQAEGYQQWEEEDEQQEEVRDLPPVPKPNVVAKPARHSPKKKQQQSHYHQSTALSPPAPQPQPMHVPLHRHIRIDHTGGHNRGHGEEHTVRSARLRGTDPHPHLTPNVFTQAMQTSLTVSGQSNQLVSNAQQQEEAAVASRNRVKNAMRAKKAHNIISSGSGSGKIVI